MIYVRLSGWLVAVALAATASSAHAQATPPLGTGNRMHDMLARSSFVERARIADNYLQNVGRADCDVVRLSFRFYRSGDYTSWRADCSDGRRFLLNFADGQAGNAEILSCMEVESSGGNCAVDGVP